MVCSLEVDSSQTCTSLTFHHLVMPRRRLLPPFSLDWRIDGWLVYCLLCLFRLLFRLQQDFSRWLRGRDGDVSRRGSGLCLLGNSWFDQKWSARRCNRLRVLEIESSREHRGCTRFQSWHLIPYLRIIIQRKAREGSATCWFF